MFLPKCKYNREIWTNTINWRSVKKKKSSKYLSQIIVFLELCSWAFPQISGCLLGIFRSFGRDWPITFNESDYFKTLSTDKHFSLGSEDDFHSGCRNISHRFSFQNYPHPDDYTVHVAIRTEVTPEFKPFTVLYLENKIFRDFRDI